MGWDARAVFARASSSSCCFFASAWRSLQVSFFAPPAGEALGAAASDWFWFLASMAAKGLTSFLGCSLMGVYAVPTGPILSSSAGLVGTFDAATGGGAEGANRAAAGLHHVRLRHHLIG